MVDPKTKEIDVLIRARYSLIYLLSWEERRVVEALREVALQQEKRLFIWSETLGLQPGTAQVTAPAADERTRNPLAALQVSSEGSEPAIYLFKDLHPFLSPQYAQASQVIRMLRDLTQSFHTSHKTVILLSPVLQLPSELDKDATVVDFDLPGTRELDGLLTRLEKSLESAGISLNLSAQAREEIVKAALGLTLTEAENVFAKCVVERKQVDVEVVVAEKEQIIRKSGLLQYYHAAERFDDVGGLDGLKQWLQGRTEAFTEKAREFGLPAPKGLLLIGVQGCGKSLTAKAVASLWKLPLLRLDVGRIFSAFVGSSEENIRKAIQIAECVSPAVLWIDEIEKGLAGAESSAALDAGVTARVFGTLITWMQEKTAPVFVVATANRISLLPPELLRKGRFDEIFFVDLPQKGEREQIFRIHLNKRKRDPEKFDPGLLADRADGFSGSEIEQVVTAALYTAFGRQRDLEQADLLQAIEETVPLSRTMPEEVAKLRAWGQSHCRMASVAREPAQVDRPV